MGKLPRRFINNIYQGDALRLIKFIPDKSVDLILTDPPYGLGKNFAGDNSLETYHKILPDCFRVLKDNTWFVTHFPIEFLPSAFEHNPFQYHWQVVIYKTGCQSRSNIGLSKWMNILVFKKGRPKLYKRSADLFVSKGHVIEPDEGFIDHPTLKNKRIIIRLLHMFSKRGDLVLDPFCGSGSVPLACKIIRRNFLGFEIDGKYVQMAKRRLQYKNLPSYSG